jgi:prepilin-type N-terminal cleavage/methylation domain-containing protein
MKKQKGFSLIELLIVVAIILIIAAIAIPNLLRSKMAANEASAVGSVRSINTAEVAYATAYPNVGYSAALANLGGVVPCTAVAATACLIDQVLATSDVNAKSGYLNTYGGVVNQGNVNVAYTLNSNPANRGTTGQRSFFSDQSGVIRYNGSAAATVADLPLQ